MHDEIVISLPKEIRVNDYHDFIDFSNMIEDLSGVKVYIDEVGYDLESQKYIGVVHLNTADHCEFIDNLIKQYDK